MTTERKAAASRANGAKSKGPKSAETRAKSSRNSLQHGFTARNVIVLECENPDEFQKLVEDYAAEYKPVNYAEQRQVDEMIAAQWRLRRIRVIETSMIDSDIRQRAQEGKTRADADPA